MLLLSSFATAMSLFLHHLNGPHQSTSLLTWCSGLLHSPMDVDWLPLMDARPDRLRLVATHVPMCDLVELAPSEFSKRLRMLRAQDYHAEYIHHLARASRQGL